MYTTPQPEKNRPDPAYVSDILNFLDFDINQIIKMRSANHSPAHLGPNINLKFASSVGPNGSESKNPHPSIADLGSHKLTEETEEVLEIFDDAIETPRFQLPGHQSYVDQNDSRSDPNDTEPVDEAENVNSIRAHLESSSLFHLPTTKETTTRRFV